MREHYRFLKLAHKLEAARTHAAAYEKEGIVKPRPIIKSCLSPLDQFLIKDFLSFYFNLGLNVKLLFTNMSFYLVVISSIAFILNVIYNKLNNLISNN